MIKSAFNMIFLGILVSIIVAVASVSGQDQCQCMGEVIFANSGQSQWFYTFPKKFPDTCKDDKTCSTNCYFLVKKFSSYFSYDRPIVGNEAPQGTTFGNFVCGHVGRDVPKGSSVQFRAQACNRHWVQVAILQNDICCVNGKYPKGGCH